LFFHFLVTRSPTGVPAGLFFVLFNEVGFLPLLNPCSGEFHGGLPKIFRFFQIIRTCPGFAFLLKAISNWECGNYFGFRGLHRVR